MFENEWRKKYSISYTVPLTIYEPSIFTPSWTKLLVSHESFERFLVFKKAGTPAEFSDSHGMFPLALGVTLGCPLFEAS